MHIEEDLFKKYHINYKKLEPFGFKKTNNNYSYSEFFLNNTFRVNITIDTHEIISGKVIDLETNEEYINFRVFSQNGEFVNKVREEYKNILINIRNNCYDQDYFISNQANRITNYIQEKYHDKPEFLWEKFKDYGVFRNKDNKKWYGIIMNIDKSKIDSGSGEIEILNIKLEEKKVSKLIKQKGFYKAYHMNKKDWISITLDDTIPDKEIITLLDESYNIIKEPINWIVPANPKYFDIINCFNKTTEIIWKQSSNINIGDIIYIYASTPYSKILYKCITTEVNIPYEYKNKFVSMSHVMKLKLLKKYKNNIYTFEYLNNLGIKTIRGPRKISKEISNNFK